MDKEADEKADKVAMEYRGAGAGRKPVLRNTSLKYISSASIGSVDKGVQIGQEYTLSGFKIFGKKQNNFHMKKSWTPKSDLNLTKIYFRNGKNSRLSLPYLGLQFESKLSKD